MLDFQSIWILEPKQYFSSKLLKVNFLPRGIFHISSLCSFEAGDCDNMVFLQTLTAYDVQNPEIMFQLTLL